MNSNTFKRHLNCHNPNSCSPQNRFVSQAAVSTSKLRNTQQEKKKAFTWHYVISFPECKFQHIQF